MSGLKSRRGHAVCPLSSLRRAAGNLRERGRNAQTVFRPRLRGRRLLARRIVADIDAAVDAAVDVVGFTIAEFIPRQVMHLQQLLSGFPLITGTTQGRPAGSRAAELPLNGH